MLGFETRTRLKTLWMWLVHYDFSPFSLQFNTKRQQILSLILTENPRFFYNNLTVKNFLSCPLDDVTENFSLENLNSADPACEDII